MRNSAQAEIFAASNAPGVYEKGGGYGQKGVDFQRYWAISRIVELVEGDSPDFLFLFESLQDVVELDSPSSPTRARIYQVKMKDTGEWTWKALTALPAEPRKKRNSTDLTVPLPFHKSPIGKLASAVAELDTIQAEGIFVSNLGCSAPLDKGSTAGSVKVCKFSELSQELRDQVFSELAKLKKTVSLESLHIQKTELSLDDPDTHVTGKLNVFLLKAAPTHVGQSKSFADGLFATLSARGRKTDPALDFSCLVAACGYSKADFLSALDTLCSVPDRQSLVNTWLAALGNERMPIRELTNLQIRVSQVLERRLGSGSTEQSRVNAAAKEWVAANPVGDSVLDFIRAGADAITAQIPGLARDEAHAAIMLEGISSA